MGDAISHAIFPGVVISYIIKIPYIIGSFIAGLVCTMLTGFIYQRSRIKQDTILGIVFSGMFAIGLVIYVTIKPDVHLDNILFGDMFGIDKQDILISTIISLFINIIIIIKWKDFFLFLFDPVQIRLTGKSIKFINYSLLFLINLTIVNILKVTGVIIAISFIITPGAISFLYTNKFKNMLLLSIIIALTTSFLGIYISFFLDSSPSSTIVLILAIIFIISFIINTKKKIN